MYRWNYCLLTFYITLYLIFIQVISKQFFIFLLFIALIFRILYLIYGQRFHYLL
jgi:hypothetical protein